MLSPLSFWQSAYYRRYRSVSSERLLLNPLRCHRLYLALCVRCRAGYFSNMFPASLLLSRVLQSKLGGLLIEFVSGGKASIFVRKTLQVRLRDRIGGKPPSSRVSRSMSGGRQSAFLSCEHESGTLACRLRKLGGKDLRFSMKMMRAPVSELRCSPF